jgi:hypothetical protein
LLLIGHFVGDFILQSRAMAFNKKASFPHLMSHVLVYTVIVTLFALPAGVLSIWQVILIFAGHAFIDQSSFAEWWVKTINGSPDIEWLVLVVDQSWHLVFLFVVAYGL